MWPDKSIMETIKEKTKEFSSFQEQFMTNPEDEYDLDQEIRAAVNKLGLQFWVVCNSCKWACKDSELIVDFSDIMGSTYCPECRKKNTTLSFGRTLRKDSMFRPHWTNMKGLAYNQTIWAAVQRSCGADDKWIQKKVDDHRMKSIMEDYL